MSGIRSVVITYTRSYRDGMGCWEDVFTSTHKSLPKLCSTNFSKLRVLDLSAWYPLCCLMPCVGFASLIPGGCAGGFLSAALLSLHRMAQESSPAPRHCSSGCKPPVRKDKPEMAESQAAKCLPQSEFVLSLSKCCSQYEGPDMRESLMVTIKKGVGSVEVCFNKKNNSKH